MISFNLIEIKIEQFYIINFIKITSLATVHALAYAIVQLNYKHH